MKTVEPGCASLCSECLLYYTGDCTADNGEDAFQQITEKLVQDYIVKMESINPCNGAMLKRFENKYPGVVHKASNILKLKRRPI